MNQKLMAFDLDGTLLFDGHISAANIDAINRWQDAGNLAVLSTGKSIMATKNALATFDLHFDHYVLYTGAVITGPDFSVTDSDTIPTAVVSKVVSMFKDSTAQVNIYATTLDTPDALLIEKVTDYSTGVLVNPHRMDPTEISQHTFVGVPMWIPHNEKLIVETQRILSQQFPEVDCHRNQDFLDIVPKNATKGAGLSTLLEALSHDSPQAVNKAPIVGTYSIGDSWNDMEMHRWAEVSASFPYSPSEIQAATTTVVETTDLFINAVLEGKYPPAS